MLDSMNVWAASRNRELLTHKDQVLRNFPDANLGLPGLSGIFWCQHAELTIAKHMIEQKLSTGGIGTIEIGVSKSCCYWCNAYINMANTKLEKDNIRAVIRGTRGKRTTGWRDT